MQYPYCKRGIVAYIRVHFAKTQVQLRLEQHSSIPHVYGINSPPFLLRRPERKGKEPKAQGDGEVCRRGRCKVASQMTTAYVVRAIER
ncbi:MAG: hypothetical protein CL920_40000 [Deltaproteobacteria bacterium]|nr:hypothetical protein [Deltaproteobacteria bacterium]